MFDRTQRYLFEDFIRDSQAAGTAEVLFAHLKRCVGQYGYDRLIFSVAYDPSLPADHHRPNIFNLYPEDWQKTYLEKGYARLDPVLHAAVTHSSAFTWANLEATSSYSPAQSRLMNEAIDAGLNSGIGVPMRALRAIGGLGLASTLAHDSAEAHLGLINALCTQFYLSYRRLHAPPPPAVLLSAKEREVLTWVAAGKTDDEVGAILGISRNTVDTHMRHIFRKLDATNRVTAVVTGLTHGHISP
ncbi:MAG: LuxR family transcriptional regulator [Asticcacaulis sp.]|uniref:LuxR family transcriptional regulator n=1 Tax=Asticcacaulis sp. TaxID=1872648 RepID=UPI0039E3864F